MRERSRFCGTCGAVVVGVCEPCKAKQQHRGNTTERGYGGDWQQLSKKIRRNNPLCVDCLEAGRTRPSIHVHHIVPIDVNPGLRMEESNLVPLCQACHDRRHTDEATIS